MVAKVLKMYILKVIVCQYIFIDKTQLKKYGK